MKDSEHRYFRSLIYCQVLRADRWLVVATFITLLLVPVIYAIFVLDLKLVKWDMVHKEPEPDT